MRPSTRTVAPAASASAMYPSMRAFASAEMTGPRSRPGTIRLAYSTIRATMWSVAETATMTDAAMHRCPAHPDIDATTLLAVISRSASGITMRWFFAPPRARQRLRLAVARR